MAVEVARVLEMFFAYKRAFPRNGRKFSARTEETYRDTFNLFGDFLSERGYPTTVEEIREEHVVEFFSMLREHNPRSSRTLKPATLSIHFRNLRAFFNWCVRHHDGFDSSPMRNLDAIEVPETDPPVHEPDEVRAILAACKVTKDDTRWERFLKRRDEALVRMFHSSGHRLSGITNLTLPEAKALVDRELDVTLKGGGTGIAFIGNAATYALHQYLLERERHPLAYRPELWLATHGRPPLTPNGVRQAIKKRAASAGVKTHPHLFRHTWTHEMKRGGVPDEVIQVAGAWKTRAMLDRYGRSAKKQRAREVMRGWNPGDTL